MKASSLPNLNRETPSFPNFFTLFQDPNHHYDPTLNKRPQINPSEDTEASETSPFKGILSPFVSFNKLNENHYPVGGSFYERNQMDQTLPRWPPSPNGSDTIVSVGSNQFSGNRSEGPNFTQMRWDRGNYLDFPEDEFRRAFKMSKSTSNLICTQLGEDMMLQSALPFTPAISQRVAFCIWHLATGEPLRLVSKRFGLGSSTCHKFLLEVCHAIKNTLMNKYVNWPDEEKTKVIKSEFESLCGIPNVGGLVYTTHVPVSAPELRAYLNSRTERTHTVTVEGVIDSKGIFTYVCIGKSGSLTDNEILENFEISLRANPGLLNGIWIVRNPGYSLTDWVLVPYQNQNLSAQVVFNDELEMVQRVAKKAIMRLKGRWRCLQEVKLPRVASGSWCLLCVAQHL